MADGSQSAGYLKAVWPEIVGPLFGRFSAWPQNELSGRSQMFGQSWPQGPSRTTGLVVQCRLHQISARQTNSKAISFFRMAQERPPGVVPTPENGLRPDPRRPRPLISAGNPEPNPVNEVLGQNSNKYEISRARTPRAQTHIAEINEVKMTQEGPPGRSPTSKWF